MQLLKHQTLSALYNAADVILAGKEIHIIQEDGPIVNDYKIQKCAWPEVGIVVITLHISFK